jgi:hypothetical protein
MMPLLNTVVVVIEHPNNPDNIITLPKSKQSKLRILAFIKQIGKDKFDDSVEAPYAKGFWINDVSKQDWEYLRHKNYVWVLGAPIKYGTDVHKWYDGWLKYHDKIADRLLDKLELDKKKYEIVGYHKCSFEPTPTLHQIKK